MASKKRISYKDAGVDIDEATRAVANIRELAKQTFDRSVLTDIGSFGGGYLLKGWKNPVLVSSADGVGTKLKLAFLTGRHDTIGEDLVNHCVNDIAVQGAVPLFFLDYFAVGKLDATVASQVVEGIARGCKRNGCALIGGETAEMPGLVRRWRIRSRRIHCRRRRAQTHDHRRGHPQGRPADRTPLDGASYQRLFPRSQAAVRGCGSCALRQTCRPGRNHRGRVTEATPQLPEADSKAAWRRIAKGRGAHHGWRDYR